MGYRYGEITHASAVSQELFMLHNGIESTGENLCYPFCGVGMVWKTTDDKGRNPNVT